MITANRTHQPASKRSSSGSRAWAEDNMRSFTTLAPRGLAVILLTLGLIFLGRGGVSP